MNNFSYSFEEFARHCKDWVTVRNYEHITINGVTREISDEHDSVTSILKIRDYMEQLYGVTDEAAEKAKLFTLMQMFLAEHAADFDSGTLAVVGKESGLVSIYLLRAIHHTYTSQPLSALGRGPSAKQVIALAKKYESE